MKWIPCLLILAALAGCDKFSQKSIEHESQQAAKHAGNAVSIGLNSLMAKIKQMEADAPPDVRDGLKKAADETDKQLRKLPTSAEVKAQLDELRKGIEKLDAQKKLDDAKKAVENAIESAKKADENMKETQERLRQADEQYRQLEQKAKEAQKQFEDASKKLKLAVTLQGFGDAERIILP